MPGWVREIDRPIRHIGVPIITLRISRVRDDGVGVGEAANTADIIAGIHVDEADIIIPCIVRLMTGETDVGQVCCGLCPPVAEGEVTGESAGY